MTNEKALTAYMGVLAEMSDRLDELQAYIEDHGMVSPDDVNWGHVGSLQAMLTTLTELTDQAYQRGEYAKQE